MSLTFAIPKGRLGDKSLEILKSVGVENNIDESRKLIFECNGNKFFLAKPTDVPTYVEKGVADIGMVGKDTILEANSDVFEILDLKIGKCYMAVAGNKDISNMDFIKVSTKYPNIAKDYFNKTNRKVEIVKLNGSVELGCIVGLSDVIVDIVESGKTLQENNLHVMEKVCDISARIIVNKASLNVKHDEIMSLINKIKDVIK